MISWKDPPHDQPAVMLKIYTSSNVVRWVFQSSARKPREVAIASSMTMKGCNFWSMLSTHGHWAVRLLYYTIHTVTRDIRFQGHLRWTVTFTYICWVAFASENAITCYVKYFNVPNKKFFCDYFLQRASILRNAKNMNKSTKLW